MNNSNGRPRLSFLRALLPRAIYPHRILNGTLRGYHIVTSWHDYPAAILGYTERPLLEWFEQNAHLGETWLDIGAHYGYTAIALCRLVGYNGRVFAFEPMLSTVGYLTQTRALNKFPQLMILPFALGSSVKFSVQNLPTTRGMVDSTLKVKGEKANAEWQETILVASLDHLWHQVCGSDERIHGIKIDVQGMEIETVRGMSTLLQKFKPKLVIEFHRGVSRDEMLSLLQRLGYSPHGIPIAPIENEVEPQYVDDRSYAFYGAPTSL